MAGFEFRWPPTQKLRGGPPPAPDLSDGAPTRPRARSRPAQTGRWPPQAPLPSRPQSRARVRIRATREAVVTMEVGSLVWG